MLTKDTKSGTPVVYVGKSKIIPRDGWVFIARQSENTLGWFVELHPVDDMMFRAVINENDIELPTP